MTIIIAEAGVNHNGDLQLAKKLVDAAKDVGADIVKFQTFKAGQLATLCRAGGLPAEGYWCFGKSICHTKRLELLRTAR